MPQLEAPESEELALVVLAPSDVVVDQTGDLCSVEVGRAGRVGAKQIRSHPARQLALEPPVHRGREAQLAALNHVGRQPGGNSLLLDRLLPQSLDLERR